MQNVTPSLSVITEASSLMTTGEVATYLRLRERTIYEMVSRQTIPFTRATGKILFPRRLIDAWLEAQTELPDAGIAPAPPIYAGSNDPLLEWALRQSGSGLAVLARGSAQGLDDLAAGRAVMSGLHLIDPQSGAWNIAAVHAHLPGSRHVLIHWARRTQGLLLATGNPKGVTGLADAVARGLRFALRSEGAGSQRLLEVLLAREGLSHADLVTAGQAVDTHTDLAALIDTGQADCGLGLQAAAGALHFLPLISDESFDLVMTRRAYFDPPVQKLLAFARTETFASRAAHLGGYDLSGLGTVVWNG
ncbi:helix-turn-helix transcriptional regulator [Roseicyclus persicicus]|uniref:Helix-turn-helix transcriptional regulator n=1 Tax=Roseicyclus persicicus TaxID=2650661 RepID=A0A7X6GY50_9RHOB|nr:helix-turn-helix transcriptional regulator [Roseibacterium persicicum]NKX44478.1 helix-turn-helix transcriptional regulator [Roseibacterium persicicum]